MLSLCTPLPWCSSLSPCCLDWTPPSTQNQTARHPHELDQVQRSLPAHFVRPPLLTWLCLPKQPQGTICSPCSGLPMHLVTPTTAGCASLTWTIVIPRNDQGRAHGPPSGAAPSPSFFLTALPLPLFSLHLVPRIFFLRLTLNTLVDNKMADFESGSVPGVWFNKNFLWCYPLLFLP